MNTRLSVRFPLFLPFVAMASGILLDHYVQPEPWLCWLMAAAISAAMAICLLPLTWAGAYSRISWFGIILLLFFLMLGALNHQFFRLAHRRTTAQPEYAVIRIDQPPQQREKSLMIFGNRLHPGTGTSMEKLMLYLENNERSGILTAGDIIMVRMDGTRHSAPLNPGEFDFQKYLQSQGIRRSEYLPSNRWRLWRKDSMFSITNLSLQLKAYLLEEIDNWPVDQEAQSLARALLLGERKSIDPRQLEAYAAAGAMHILAVSGLHTGIFYLILTFLFRPINKWRFGRATSSVLTLLMLWSYAIITGLSPSVVRAVCMFSLLALGNGRRRKANVYNTILASAFILLLAMPGFLFQVGFQLSYAAILGIVSIQPHLSRVLKPRYWLLRKIWDLISVSIAAQITTLPLALYYFHHFPTLFILTNLLVIPMVSLIMYLGLFCLLVSLLPLSANILFRLFGLMVNLMNDGVSGIELLDLHLTHLYLSALGGLSIYLLTYFLYRWCTSGRYTNLVRSGLLALLLISLGALRWVRLNQTELIVYQVPGSPVLGIFRNNKGIVYTDQSSVSDSTRLNYKLNGHWQQRSVAKPNKLTFQTDTTCSYFVKRGPLIFIPNRSMLIYDDHFSRIPDIDVWLVTTNLGPPDFKENSPSMVVLTSSVNNYWSEIWKKWCYENGINMWDVKRSGAWTTNGSFI